MDEILELGKKILSNLEYQNKQLEEIRTIEKKVQTGFDYININDLADLTGLSTKTLYTRVYKKEIPYYKPGGKLLLFKISEIKEWVKEARHSSLSELQAKI